MKLLVVRMMNIKRLRHLAAMLLLVACCAPIRASARQGAPGTSIRKGGPIVAVFDIQTRGASLSKEELEQLSEILASSLAAGGVYRIVPRAQLHSRLRQQKAASYKNCFDQSCQIAVGRELAAQKTLVTKIHRIGSNCTITAVMYDLRTGTSEGGGHATVPCELKNIARSLQTIAKHLEKIERKKAPRKAPAPTPATSPRSPAPRPPARPASIRLSSERLRLTTADHSRTFDVTVVSTSGGTHKCRLSLASPCVLPRIALGKTRVLIKSDGLYGFSRALTLDNRAKADEWVDIRVMSRPHALSIVGWALGGVALATGVALGAVGGGIDSPPMIAAGAITGGVGALVIVGSFFLRSTVDASTGIFNLGWDLLSLERAPRRQWTLSPTLGGALLRLRW